MTTKGIRKERKPRPPVTDAQRPKMWAPRASADPHAANRTERETMERTSPFLNGDAAPKKPKTLRRLKSNRLVAAVHSKTLLFKVALPCYHWALENGECRHRCDAWLEAGGKPKKDGGRVHVQSVPS